MIDKSDLEKTHLPLMKGIFFKVAPTHNFILIYLKSRKNEFLQKSQNWFKKV